MIADTDLKPRTGPMQGADLLPRPLLEFFLNRLQTLGSGSREMDEIVHFYRCLIPAMQAARTGIPPTGLDARTCAQKLSDGTPILLNEVLEIHPADSQRVFSALCRAAAQGSARSLPALETEPGAPDCQPVLEKLVAIEVALALGPVPGQDAGGILSLLDPRALLFMLANGDSNGIQQVAGNTPSTRRFC